MHIHARNTTILWILLIKQLDAQNLVIISLLNASTCLEYYVLIIRRSELYYTSSGIITTVVGPRRLEDDSERFETCLPKIAFYVIKLLCFWLISFFYVLRYLLVILITLFVPKYFSRYHEHLQSEIIMG